MQPTRRSYSKSFKIQVIQECAQPGASIASIALHHNLNANLVHKWIRLQGIRPAIPSCVTKLVSSYAAVTDQSHSPDASASA
ncbi:transposase [Pseudomonas syringae]|uniref:transposase n=1 Tax=Pseudomonas syringae TaxID=317 RepID=UPI0013736216